MLGDIIAEGNVDAIVGTVGIIGDRDGYIGVKGDIDEANESGLTVGDTTVGNNIDGLDNPELIVTDVINYIYIIRYFLILSI